VRLTSTHRIAPLAFLLFCSIALSGCAALSHDPPELITLSNKLKVVTSAPLSGAQQADGEAMVNGERLALADAHGVVGAYTVSLVVLNSVEPQGQLWSRGQVAENAALAVADLDAVAYIGESGALASQVSLPITNQGQLLQVAPSDWYSGLTDASFAASDEPGRYSPSGKPNFGRIGPSQLREAEAEARLQHDQGCATTLILGGSSPEQSVASRSLAAALKSQSVGVAGVEPLGSPLASASSVAASVSRSGADCLFYAGPADRVGAQLLSSLKRAVPALKLFAGREQATALFARSLSGAARRSILFTAPAPDLARLKGPAAELASRYRRSFGSAIVSEALYGYEAMSVVLDSIARAGRRARNRTSVIAAFRATSERDSVVGRYSVGTDGNSTLSSFVVLRVVGGALVASPGLSAAIRR